MKGCGFRGLFSGDLILISRGSIYRLRDPLDCGSPRTTNGMRIHIANFAISFTGPSASPGHKILEKKKDRRAGPSWVSSSCSAASRAPGGSPARGPPGRPADASLGGPACGPAPACRSPCSPCSLPCCHSHASLLLTKIAITATIMPTTMSSGTRVIIELMASWFSMP